MENDISKIQESTFKPFKKVTKIILDTSVLNHLFSHNINIGAEILAILNLYKEDVWIPNTVYKEFLKIDEKKLIASKVKEYKDIGKCLKEEYNSFNQKVQNIFMKVDNNKLFEDWEEIKDKLNFS
ncbi:MAG: PIN-like domain-containing protein [Clostridium neonatale]